MMVLTPHLLIKEDSTQLAMAAADIFVRTAIQSVEENGRFAVAISGGSTPRKMHRLLAEPPHVSKIPWDRTHLFWVDDRCVPGTHPASNYGAAKKDFLSRVPIPESQIHPIPRRMPPDESARQYQETITGFFHLSAGGVPAFDLIFLGMGTDGHTASLFPGATALNNRNRNGKDRLAVAVKGGNPDIYRVTLTLPVLNHARNIVFLVSGKEKAPMLRTILNDPKKDLPAQQVQPGHGKLTWLTDRAAASLLP